MSTQAELEHWQDYLETALPSTGGSPVTVRIYRETSSTQDIAKTFAPGPALVVADQQTAGRGRLGRSWLSTPGASVLMSVCWPADHIGTTHDRVSMSAGVAVARAVEQLAPDVTVRLKWPNDVLVDERKLAGILIEGTKSTFIIGIGLNVSPDACKDPNVKQNSTSLSQLRRSVDRLQVIETLYTELNCVLSKSNPSRLQMDWRARAALGQTQTFEQAGQRVTGEVIDLDPDHGLIVRRDSGELITLPAATTSVVK